jgi:hypothetical protein
VASDSDQSQKTELAERPRDGEGWSGMIQRQEKEGTNKGGFSRELMRSLPDDQREDKPPPKKSDLNMDEPLMVENVSYDQMVRESSQRAGQDQDRGIDR